MYHQISNDVKQSKLSNRWTSKCTFPLPPTARVKTARHRFPSINIQDTLAFQQKNCFAPGLVSEFPKRRLKKMGLSPLPVLQVLSVTVVMVFVSFWSWLSSSQWPQEPSQSSGRHDTAIPFPFNWMLLDGGTAQDTNKSRCLYKNILSVTYLGC